ncbi:MAG: hypothetical protein PHF94_04685 [Methanothrix sp.]|nr:hypothetical protein [Methanothrix sp.]
MTASRARAGSADGACKWEGVRPGNSTVLAARTPSACPSGSSTPGKASHMST